MLQNAPKKSESTSGNPDTWSGLVRQTSPSSPPRILIYGPPGVGKSTFGSRMPYPLFLDFEDGLSELRVSAITPPSMWSQVLDTIRAIARDHGPYRSLVIDTADKLEDLAADHVCKVEKKKSLSDFGYGTGYDALASVWQDLLIALDAVRSSGMIVCLLTHAMVRTAQDPTLGTYDQFVPQLQKKTWAITHRWCDLVGFAAIDAALSESRVIVTGERVLHTQRGTGFEAKNRFNLPVRLPFDWAPLDEAIQSHRQKSQSTTQEKTT